MAVFLRLKKPIFETFCRPKSKDRQQNQVGTDRRCLQTFHEIISLPNKAKVDSEQYNESNLQHAQNLPNGENVWITQLRLFQERACQARISTPHVLRNQQPDFWTIFSTGDGSGHRSKYVGLGKDYHKWRRNRGEIVARFAF